MKLFRLSFLPMGVFLTCMSLILTVAIVGCAEKIRPSVTDLEMSADLPTQESWNSVITFTDSGRVTAIVHAGRIAMYAQKKYTLLSGGIKVEFFDREEERTSVLTAEQGKVNDVTHDLEATGNVVVVSDTGTTLMTSALFWENATQRIFTNAFVEIISPTEKIQGHGLESDQSLRNYRIFHVTGQALTKE